MQPWSEYLEKVKDLLAKKMKGKLGDTHYETAPREDERVATATDLLADAGHHRHSSDVLEGAEKETKRGSARSYEGAKSLCRCTRFARP